jgi:hypothetical protein
VGGHARKIGKTSLIASLLGRLRKHRWTALKITRHGHAVCSNHGTKPTCGCDPEGGEEFSLTEEYAPGESDSGRFLAAGAERSFWMRLPANDTARAIPVLHKVLAQSPNAIVESTSVLDLVQPDLFLMLLDFSSTEFKPSSFGYMDRADAFVVVDRGFNAPLWDAVSQGRWDEKPRFLVNPPDYVSKPLVEFVISRLASSAR